MYMDCTSFLDASNSMGILHNTFFLFLSHIAFMYYFFISPSGVRFSELGISAIIWHIVPAIGNK
jgi:hypothetical protein